MFPTRRLGRIILGFVLLIIGVLCLAWLLFDWFLRWGNVRFCCSVVLCLMVFVGQGMPR